MADGATVPTIRDAVKADVSTIIRLLRDDELGQGRESGEATDADAYRHAFDEIDDDPKNRLIVADLDGDVVACMQITVIPHLVFCGGKRLQIEGVRVDKAFRSQNIGQQMINWAIDVARETGCHLVQLTSNKLRKDAQRFYENAGFAPSHIGFKYALD